MGIWVAHGEGRADFSSPDLHREILDNNLAPLRYVDDACEVTQAYPHNPNGSPDGIAGLCSPCGRHLAMMPHPGAHRVGCRSLPFFTRRPPPLPRAALPSLPTPPPRLSAAPLSLPRTPPHGQQPWSDPLLHAAHVPWSDPLLHGELCVLRTQSDAS